MYKVIIVDDHELISKGIASLIDSYPNYEVLHMARHGKELMQLLKEESNTPDIILLDINMPVMNGFETMEWLGGAHPNIPVLALTINNDDESVIKMLRLGVKGYLLKDTDVDELIHALNTIMKKGFYASDFMNSKLIDNLNKEAIEEPHKIVLKEREQEFLTLAASDMTYVQIAEKMFLSPKTVDHYREALFEKFEVKSRVGLVMYAMKHGLITLD